MGNSRKNALGRRNTSANGFFEEQKEGQFVNKLWYVHTMEYYAAVKE